jgi:hypothetical protein
MLKKDVLGVRNAAIARPVGARVLYVHAGRNAKME